MQASVIVFPGSNCDRDVKVSLQHATKKPVHMVWHGDSEIPKSDLIVLPGGFSYGDYLRCGAISAKSRIMKAVIAAAHKGTPILGICNGFQILIEAGLLPGALTRNAGLKFICKDVFLRVENNETIFTNKYNAGAVIRIPVAHHDGNYFADEATLNRLESNNQIAFRYCAEQGEVTETSNINGSQRNIAGIYNESKNILGMMPHPERLDQAMLGGTDGAHLFNSLVDSLA
ncbi:MAG: phosphoribosylformylglycinamidine synthase subunit PurQ [Rhizobiales bacterium]|nr:phosphoribosylformylglycinamidine synthase subunit PurQ [Hyphomicrobiales bacterium]NRB13796.1 phosphoribosylformylglycinamidine synthase subunit PurQ [Hyphomicrobiales bacterium]